MKRIILLGWNVLRYNSKPVPILPMKNMPKQPKPRDKNNAQGVMVIEENDTCLVRVERQTKIRIRSEAIVLVATDERWILL